MVHSEVYPNKYVVSIAPFSPPPFRKLIFFSCFRFFNFSSIFPGRESADPICAYVRTPNALMALKQQIPFWHVGIEGNNVHVLDLTGM